jgi:hypothetical protein
VRVVTSRARGIHRRPTSAAGAPARVAGTYGSPSMSVKNASPTGPVPSAAPGPDADVQRGLSTGSVVSYPTGDG